MKAYFSGFMNTIIFIENRFFRRKLTEHERWHEISWKKNLISSTIQRLRCLQIWPSKGPFAIITPSIKNEANPQYDHQRQFSITFNLLRFDLF